MNDIHISKLSIDDKPNLLKFIRNQNLEDHFLFTRWKNALTSDADLNKIIESECNIEKNNGFRIIAKTTNNEICGYGLIDFFPQKDKQHVSVVGTIVDKDFRKKGIGKLLLEEEINISKLCNKLKIRASAHEHNVASIKLHESLGFTQEGKFVAEEFRDKYLNVISLALFLDPMLLE